MAVEKQVAFGRKQVDNVRIVSENVSGFGNELSIGSDGRAAVDVGEYLEDTIVGTAVPSADTAAHQFSSQALTQPMVIALDGAAVGYLTLYRDNGTNAIARLYAGDKDIFYIQNTNLLWYKFSTHAATEVFYWRSGA